MKQQTTTTTNNKEGVGNLAGSWEPESTSLESLPGTPPSCQEDEINPLFSPLPAGPFQVIYADCPWNYRGRVQHGGRDVGYTSNADKFYETIQVEGICALPVADIKDPKEAILFQWATGPCLEDALRVMEAWGFKYKQIAFVWEKQRINPGYYSCTSCEYVLVGTHKRIPKPRGARNVRQFFSGARTDHSAKPDEIARRIEQMFPEQRKIELFARDPREGWTVWGKEVEEAA